MEMVTIAADCGQAISVCGSSMNMRPHSGSREMKDKSQHDACRNGNDSAF
jgi:hypothetical protein